MDDCIFCKIATGEIPSHQIYSDNDFIIFLDAFPKYKGHSLIVPIKHYENIFDLPDELASKTMQLGKKLAIALENSINADGYNFLQNNRETSGQEVMHYHLHLIPRYEQEGKKGIPGITGNMEYNPSKEELAQLALEIGQAYQP